MTDLLVLVTRHPGVPEDQRRRLLDAHSRVRVELIDSPEALAERLPEADGIVTAFALPSGAVARSVRLRWVHSMSAGVDTFLTPELRAAEHVVLTASKGPLGESMAEHALALMLALARNLSGFLADQHARRWRRMMSEQAHVTELTGRTIAILGVGAVGGHLARMCKLGLGMRVLGMARVRREHPHVDRYFEPPDLHAALVEADVVSLSLPASAATKHIIDAAALAAMKSTAFLVNVARGRLVDEEALITALRSGQIAGAGLDTLTVEPPPNQSPLWQLSNVLITPHTSAVTDRLATRLVDFWADNIARFAEERPLCGVVDRDAGY
ncbi:MAG: D-2-hydroxyacid dehydrogenase [Chloroflexota bacterium]